MIYEVVVEMAGMAGTLSIVVILQQAGLGLFTWLHVSRFQEHKERSAPAQILFKRLLAS